MEMLGDASIWVLISFIVFCAMAWKLGKDKITSALDNKIDTIRKEIETAESLRVEAQELLAQYQRKQRDAAKEAEQIIENAKMHAKEIKKKAKEELKETMERREQQLSARIERMEQSAIQEIRSHAADLAVKATKEIISERLDKNTSKELVDQSIQNISGQLT
jgi:F-type H+-transporting ATPase subunit b